MFYYVVLKSVELHKDGKLKILFSVRMLEIDDKWSNFYLLFTKEKSKGNNSSAES